jgi:hypothetical protein
VDFGSIMDHLWAIAGGTFVYIDILCGYFGLGILRFVYAWGGTWFLTSLRLD